MTDCVFPSYWQKTVGTATLDWEGTEVLYTQMYSIVFFRNNTGKGSTHLVNLCPIPHCYPAPVS